MNTGPFKMNPGFNKLPAGVQDKILKKAAPKKTFPTNMADSKNMNTMPRQSTKKMPVETEKKGLEAQKEAVKAGALGAVKAGTQGEQGIEKKVVGKKASSLRATTPGHFTMPEKIQA